MSVSNAHLPPEFSDQGLSRLGRWMLRRPFLATIALTLVGTPLDLGLLLWRSGKPLEELLLTQLPMLALFPLVMYTGLRQQRRRYYRDR